MDGGECGFKAEQQADENEKFHIFVLLGTCGRRLMPGSRQKLSRNRPLAWKKFWQKGDRCPFDTFLEVVNPHDEC